MENECECCGESSRYYYLGMCGKCVKSLPEPPPKLDEHRIAIAYYDLLPILISGLKNLEGGSLVLREWDKARREAERAATKEVE